MSLMIFKREKKLPYTIKTRSFKSRKIIMFSWRLVNGFGQKIDNIPCFYFGKIGQ